MEERSRTKEKMHKLKKETHGLDIIRNILVMITVVLGIAFYILYFKKIWNSLDYMQNTINASILLLVLLSVGSAFITKKTLRALLSTFACFLIIGAIIFNILIINDKIKLSKRDVAPDFTNKEYSYVLVWAGNNKISLTTSYENSDNIKEGYIISQTIYPGTLLSKIKDMGLIISEGPNYDKEVLLTSMLDWDLEDVLKYIKENHLSNVIIDYEISNDIPKDKVISQSTKGSIKRNTEITITFSLGKKENLKDIEIENLVNMSLFDATLYLKKYGITYELKYEYSDIVKKDFVTKQSIGVGMKVNPNTDKIILTISKGKEVSVPDFSNKTIEDVIKWANENGLRIAFEEEYSVKIDSGKLIRINFKVGDAVSEGDKIIITTSKGALLFPEFTSLSNFRNWANNLNLKYTETFQYDASIEKGKIIKFSVETGSKIDLENYKEITVYISNGSAVTVPYFVGKTKSAVTTECNKIGLNCTFYYTGYSSTAKDTATIQNISSGTKVISGAYVNIGLSSGPAKTCNIFIQSEWYRDSYTADSTISILKTKITEALNGKGCYGVTLKFEKKAHNTLRAGLIHEDSPKKGGNNDFTDGLTYTFWIVN